MYTISHDGRPLYDPRVRGYGLENPTLTQEGNKHGALTFTIYPGNPEYGEIRKLRSMLRVYSDGAEICRLRPVYAKENMRGGIETRCEEISAWMNDFICRPGYFAGTVSAYIGELLDQYNEAAYTGGWALDGRIQAGRLLHAAETEGEFINDEYIGFWDLLQKKVVGEHGGYLRIRYEEGAPYLDYLGDGDLPMCGQPIRFGENLAELFMETDASNTFSVLIPLGKDVRATNIHAGQARNTPLTIAAVNDGKDYLESAQGITLYGRRERTERWEDIGDAAALKAKGQEYLDANAVRLADTVTLTAMDLHAANMSIEALRFLSRVRAESVKHGLSEIYTLKKMQVPLGRPQGTRVQFGDTKESLTDRIRQNAAQARGAYSSLSSRVYDVENPEEPEPEEE